MQICCTKKLQEQLGIVIQDGIEGNDLFCWSAHLITVKRRKTIVVVNDSNRFGFIFYGLKVKDFKYFNALILQGIRNCLEDEKIKDEIIEQYLKAAGELRFTKTRGRGYVARLNKACELAALCEEKFDSSNLFQVMATRIINNDLIKIDKQSGYEYLYEWLHRDLRKCYGESIIKCEAVTLIIKLDLGSYCAQRVIIVPVDINFRQLHEILQVVFDWKNYHLHGFNIFDEEGLCQINIVCDYEEDEAPHPDLRMTVGSEVKLLSYADKQYKINYCYDYGDSWEHEITIQDINADYDKNYPICIMGEGNAPPEDVGGIPGFEVFLEIMADPSHVEYKNTKEWVSGQRYKDLDIDLVNRRLKNILRR